MSSCGVSAHLIGDNQIMALQDTEFIAMDNLKSSVKYLVLSKGNRTKSDSMGFASQGRGLKEIYDTRVVVYFDITTYCKDLYRSQSAIKKP